jgi:Cu-Zn family superoxide dismutase
MKISGIFVGVALLFAAAPASAADITIKVRAIDAKGIGKEIGKIRAVDTKAGLKLIPRLSGLTPGIHGIHVHQNPNCRNRGADGKTGAGLAAGGHFDPAKTGHHMGPTGAGHQGDLPVLIVDNKGDAQTAMLAPHLKVTDLWGHAVIIHAGGDNYADQPTALGGGGARIACATIVMAKKRTTK